MHGGGGQHPPQAAESGQHSGGVLGLGGRSRGGGTACVGWARQSNDVRVDRGPSCALLGPFASELLGATRFGERLFSDAPASLAVPSVVRPASAQAAAAKPKAKAAAKPKAKPTAKPVAKSVAKQVLAAAPTAGAKPTRLSTKPAAAPRDGSTPPNTQHAAQHAAGGSDQVPTCEPVPDNPGWYRVSRQDVIVARGESTGQMKNGDKFRAKLPSCGHLSWVEPQTCPSKTRVLNARGGRAGLDGRQP